MTHWNPIIRLSATAYLFALLIGCAHHQDSLGTDRVYVWYSHRTRAEETTVQLVSEGAAKIEFSSRDSERKSSPGSTVLIPANPNEVRRLARAITGLSAANVADPIHPLEAMQFADEDTFAFGADQDNHRTEIRLHRLQTDGNELWGGLIAEVEMVGAVDLARSIVAFEQGERFREKGQKRDASDRYDAAVASYLHCMKIRSSRYGLIWEGGAVQSKYSIAGEKHLIGGLPRREMLMEYPGVVDQEILDALRQAWLLHSALHFGYTSASGVINVRFVKSLVDMEKAGTSSEVSANAIGALDRNRGR